MVLSSYDNFLKAIFSETTEVWKVYYDSIGKLVENLKEGEFFDQIYPIYEDYFLVYKNSAALLGRVDNDDVRSLIIKTYTISKGLDETFRCNNDSLETYKKAKFDNNLIMIKDITGELIDYAPKIKQHHNEVKESMERLVEVLSEEIYKR